MTYWKRVCEPEAQGFSDIAHHFSSVCWHARFCSGGPAVPKSLQAHIHPHKFSCYHSGRCLNVNLFVHCEGESSMLLWFVGKTYDPTWCESPDCSLSCPTTLAVCVWGSESSVPFHNESTWMSSIIQHHNNKQGINLSF